MSVESEEQKTPSWRRIFFWGTTLFLLLFALIIGLGIYFSVSESGEFGVWLRSIRDFLLVGILLELALLTGSAVILVWRLVRFIESTSREISLLSGDARETARIAQESIETLHRLLVQPVLQLHALWVELKGLVKAWLGFKQAMAESEKPAPVQTDPDSS
ncbi:MAG: hypothetical protein OXF83_07875 [Anaerolineaceae bacterium]|nr:hypothetical protein [Anaerolineaceae bacterium]